jgi:hypothetical protein
MDEVILRLGFVREQLTSSFPCHYHSAIGLCSRICDRRHMILAIDIVFK